MSVLDDARATLKAPATGLSWLQLAAAVVFVIVVAFMWRQVTHFIMGEI
jgi:hypothetical protein